MQVATVRRGPKSRRWEIKLKKKTHSHQAAATKTYERVGRRGDDKDDDDDDGEFVDVGFLCRRWVR